MTKSLISPLLHFFRIILIVSSFYCASLILSYKSNLTLFDLIDSSIWWNHLIWLLFAFLQAAEPKARMVIISIFFSFFVYSIMKFLLSYRMPNLLPSLQIQFRFDATKLCAHQASLVWFWRGKKKIAMYKASLSIFHTQLVWWRGKKAVSKCSSSIWEIGWCSKPTFIIWTL